MKNWWWIAAFLLTLALSATETFICDYSEDGKYQCSLISEKEKIIEPVIYDPMEDYQD